MLSHNDVLISQNDEYSHQIESFIQKFGIHKIIAFSGGADISFPGLDQCSSMDDDKDVFESGLNLKAKLEEATRLTQEYIIMQAIRFFQGQRIAILCGGTKWGIPHTAAKCAKKCGLKIIAVMPRGGVKYSLPPELLDLRIIVEPRVNESYWGDESSIFAKLLDGVIVYAGGAGTLIEVSHILKMNERFLKYDEPLKYIVPIIGSGGVADSLYHFPVKPDVKNACMPLKTIASGSAAARFLIEKLSIYDNYEI